MVSVVWHRGVAPFQRGGQSTAGETAAVGRYRGMWRVAALGGAALLLVSVFGGRGQGLGGAAGCLRVSDRDCLAVVEHMIPAPLFHFSVKHFFIVHKHPYVTSTDIQLLKEK